MTLIHFSYNCEKTFHIGFGGVREGFDRRWSVARNNWAVWFRTRTEITTQRRREHQLLLYLPASTAYTARFTAEVGEVGEVVSMMCHKAHSTGARKSPPNPTIEVAAAPKPSSTRGHRGPTKGRPRHQTKERDSLHGAVRYVVGQSHSCPYSSPWLTKLPTRTWTAKDIAQSEWGWRPTSIRQQRRTRTEEAPCQIDWSVVRELPSIITQYGVSGAGVG